MEMRALWCSLLVGSCCLLIRTVSANLEGQLYLNNYITAVEDVSSDPASFMVTTADSNYAIFSPRFQRIGWLSVTINEDLVFIVTSTNSTLTRRMLELSEEERDLIAEVRANFLQNLTGLKLSRAVASDSLLLMSNKLAYANSELYASSGKEGNLKLSLAEQAIHLIDSVNQPDLRDKDDDGGGRHEPLKEPKQLKESKSRRSLSLAAGKLRGQRARGYQYQARLISSGPPNEDYRQNIGPGFCLRKSPAQFNYYNLLGFYSKESLSGDIYNFDLRCNILDVYSSSVSIKQTTGLSALYRDENYFAYSQSDLPRYINRFFLINDKVFFVYHDRSLLLKHDWLLDPLELDVVVNTRRKFRTRPKAGRSSETQTSPDDVRQDEQQETGSEQVTGNEQPGESDASGQRALANGGRKQ